MQKLPFVSEEKLREIIKDVPTPFHLYNESGIRKTVEWYLAHKDDWCAHVLNGSYKMERLGTGGAQ